MKKYIKLSIILVVALSVAACSATPTRRTINEQWKDTKISNKIRWKMGRDKLVHETNISVQTWRNVVTLTGRVTSEEEKTKAIEIAKNVKGVKDVRDYLDLVGPADVPVKVVKENIPFSKPAGKYDNPSNIAVPTLALDKTTATTTPAKIREEDLKKSEPKEKEDGVSYQIKKDLAVDTTSTFEEQDDITLQAEKELKELKKRKGK